MSKNSNNSGSGESTMASVSKLGLIHSQLVYNITLGVQRDHANESTMLNNSDVAAFRLSDQARAKCVHLLVRMLRSHRALYDAATTASRVDRATIDSLSLSRQLAASFAPLGGGGGSGSREHRYDDELHADECRILTKALQSLENLFAPPASTGSATSTPAANSDANWISHLSAEFQLGDILAIIKVTNKQTSSFEL